MERVARHPSFGESKHINTIKEILNMADIKANALGRYLVVISNIFKPPCNFPFIIYSCFEKGCLAKA